VGTAAAAVACAYQYFVVVVDDVVHNHGIPEYPHDTQLGLVDEEAGSGWSLLSSLRSESLEIEIDVVR
jgi:hypothetical protein